MFGTKIMKIFYQCKETAILGQRIFPVGMAIFKNKELPVCT